MAVSYFPGVEHRASGSALPAAILFDMDDTVVDTYRASSDAWREAAARLGGARGWDLEQASAAFFAADRWYWQDQERADWGRLNQAGARTRIARRALDELGWRDDGAAAWAGPFVVQERINRLQPFPGALETLVGLRRRGVALALVTNGETPSQRGKIDKVGLVPYFDVVVVEGEFGIGKPDPAVFRHALAAVGRQPHEAWMVGDDLAKDIAGGAAAGLHTVWVDSRREGLPDAPAAQPHRIVHAIAELLPVA